MSYHIEQNPKNKKWFVYDNANVQVPSHGFKTKKKPVVSFYFASIILLCITII